MFCLCHGQDSDVEAESVNLGKVDRASCADLIPDVFKLTICQLDSGE